MKRVVCRMSLYSTDGLVNFYGEMTISILGKNSAVAIFINIIICCFFVVVFFFQKIGFDISCKLSPKETICMECQSLFPAKK